MIVPIQDPPLCPGEHSHPIAPEHYAKVRAINALIAADGGADALEREDRMHLYREQVQAGSVYVVFYYLHCGTCGFVLPATSVIDRGY